MKKNVTCVSIPRKVLTRTDLARLKRGYLANVPISTLEGKFHLSRPTIIRILKELGIYREKKLVSTNGWSYERVLERIKFLYKKKGDSLKAIDWKQAGQPSLHAILYKFDKSWNDLLNDAGLIPTLQPNYWNRKNLKKKFQELLSKGEVTPLRQSFSKHPELPSPRVTTRLFGSHRAFLLACGIRPIYETDLWYQWEKCCEAIAHAKYGHIVVQSHTVIPGKRPDIYVPSENLIIDAMVTAYDSEKKIKQLKAYSGKFKLECWCLYNIGKEMPGGTYRYAAELTKEVGLSRVVRKLIKNISHGYYGPEYKQFLIDALKKLAIKIGGTPSAYNLRTHGLPSWEVYKKAFGSFPEAIKAAGLNQRDQWQKYSDSDLIEALRKKQKVLKRPIRPKDFRSKGWIDRRVFVVRYGSLENACKKAQVPFDRLKRRR